MNVVRWVLVTALGMAFLLLAVANWTPVPFRLPDGAIVSVPLPVLLGIAFAAGWLPTLAYHAAAKARWKHNLGKPAAGSTVLPSPPSAVAPVDYSAGA